MADQPSQSPAERLRELKGLHDDGVISGDEFEEMRAPLLKELASTGDTVPNDAPAPVAPVESSPEPLEAARVTPDSFNDDWPMSARLLIAGGVVLVIALVIAAANYRNIEHWAFPERSAYDTGVETFHKMDDRSSGYLSCEYLRQKRQSVDSSDGASVANALYQVNTSLRGIAEAERTRNESSWDPSEDVFFINGYWDEAARTCPEAFANPIIAGRP